MSTSRQVYLARYNNSIPHLNVTDNGLFSSTIIESENVDSYMRRSISLVLFIKRLFALTRPFANCTFRCHRSKSLKLVIRLRMTLTDPIIQKKSESFSTKFEVLMKAF